MRRFWLILLSLGLVIAFSVSAFAVDVKVSAEYYAAGMYLNKTSLMSEGWGSSYDSPSTAFFYQRLRVGTDFVVSPSLKLVTRFDAMERIWGGTRSEADDYDWMSAGTRAESENIAVDLVYIDYTSPIGKFLVGYQPYFVWGTVFADYANGVPIGQIQYFRSFGPANLVLGYGKLEDNSYSAVNNSSWNSRRTDRDADAYKVGGSYNFKDGEVGALLTWNRDASCRGRSCDSYLTSVFTIDPYVKAKIGPVNIQAEAQYIFGDAEKYEGYVTGATDVKVDALSVFVDATASFGMFNVGGSFAYLSGDDPNTEDKYEGGQGAGLDWNPCLILFNNDIINYWVGGDIEGFGGNDASKVGGPMRNAWFFQGRVGVKPTPQFDAMLSISYAQADKSPLTNGDRLFTGKTYGTEVDITGTYKITNNLSYMMGIGYLFTGDYFKGCDNPANRFKINDDYMIINKLILTF